MKEGGFMNRKIYPLLILILIIIISVLACGKSSIESVSIPNTPAETTIVKKLTPTRNIEPTAIVTATFIMKSSDISLPIFKDEMIEIFNLSHHETHNKELVVYGEARNIGNEKLKSIQVTLSIYDTNNNILDTNHSYVKLPWGMNIWNEGVLYPNEKAPFKIILEHPGNWEKMKVSLNYDFATKGDIANHYHDLTILNSTGREISELFYNYQIIGEYINSGNSTCGNLWLVATAYNKDGEVIGCESGLVETGDTLPGEERQFTFDMYVRDQVEFYELLFYAINLD